MHPRTMLAIAAAQAALPARPGEPQTRTAVPWQIENGLRGSAHATEPHDTRAVLRVIRSLNIDRKFATGHWQRAPEPVEHA